MSGPGAVEWKSAGVAGLGYEVADLLGVSIDFPFAAAPVDGAEDSLVTSSLVTT